MIRSVIRQMMAMAVVPQQYVPSLFGDREQELGDQEREELTDFFLYFNKQWMHQVPMWNVFDIPERTNNFSEGMQKQNIHYAL